MKSVFSSPIDKYFIGKVFFGLIFMSYLCKALLAGFALIGTYKASQGFIAKAPISAFVVYSIISLIGFIGFFVVEKRRKNHLNSKDIK